MQKAVFLDKDGTLIEDIPYNVDPSRIRLTEDSIEGLKRLSAAGYLLIAVTNQSGVARGYFPEQALQNVRIKLEKLLSEAGVALDGFYYCPHHPDGIAPYNIFCDCRKPLPGLILRAAKERGIDLSRSWMIGDILNDVEAGNRAGCGTVLIDNGNETEWKKGNYREPDFVCRNIDQAAQRIFDKETSSSEPSQLSTEV